MHYWQRHIGDYAKKAGGLSMIEHGAYTLLLDGYYDRERGPTRDEAMEWCWARTPEQMAAVEFVLRRFFTLGEDGVYRNERADEEIAAYYERAETNRQIALAREEKRRAAREAKAKEGDDSSTTEHDSCTNGHLTNNQEPITNNHKPVKKRNTQRFDAAARLRELGVPEKACEDWLALRKAKRLPVTETALEQISKEIALIGWTWEQAILECCGRGWAGFKAKWLNDSLPGMSQAAPARPNKQQALEARNTAAAEQFLAQGGGL